MEFARASQVFADIIRYCHALEVLSRARIRTKIFESCAALAQGYAEHGAFSTKEYNELYSKGLAPSIEKRSKLRHKGHSPTAFSTERLLMEFQSKKEAAEAELRDILGNLDADQILTRNWRVARDRHLIALRETNQDPTLGFIPTTMDQELVQQLKNYTEHLRLRRMMVVHMRRRAQNTT